MIYDEYVWDAELYGWRSSKGFVYKVGKEFQARVYNYVVNPGTDWPTLAQDAGIWPSWEEAICAVHYADSDGPTADVADFDADLIAGLDRLNLIYQLSGIDSEQAAKVGF